MNIEELKNILKPNIRIEVDGEKFKILQHIVWWQAKGEECYDKYVLEDEKKDNGIRLFISGEYIGISRVFKHDFKEPMPQKLEFEGKEYRMTEDQFCIVKECQGQEFYKVGDCEIWWDYELVGDDNQGLSLGRDWQTWEREDLKVKSVSINNIKILK